MGIPHGGFDKQPMQKSPPKFNPEEVPLKRANEMPQEFPPFDEVFKPKGVKEQSNSGSAKKPPPFENSPQQPYEENRKAEAFEIDFNNTENNIEDQPLKTEASTDPNVLNVDDIAIKPKQQLTFEQMIEKELQEKKTNTEAVQDDDRVIRK